MNLRFSDGQKGLEVLKTCKENDIGMPKEAIKLGTVDHVLPLTQLAPAALQLCR